MTSDALTPDKQRALYDSCTGIWHKVRRSIRNADLPEIDWEDMRSAALLRVFSRYDLYDPARPLGPWIYTVMWRVAQNELRRRFPQKNAQSRARYRVRRPMPLMSKVVETDDWGNEDVVTIPDIPAQVAEYRHDPAVIASFVKSLKGKEREGVRIALDGGEFADMQRALRLKKREHGYAFARELRAKWRRHLQTQAA